MVTPAERIYEAAAAALGRAARNRHADQTKTENDQALKQLQADFARMTAGLVTEILGFALAAGVHF